MGAAISVESADEWMSSLSVVRGVVTNAYCKKDYILQLYKAAVFKNPIGLSPLLLDNNETPENHFRINNWDVTNEAQGHTYYRERLERILDAINFIKFNRSCIKINNSARIKCLKVAKTLHKKLDCIVFSEIEEGLCSHGYKYTVILLQVSDG